MKIPSHNYMAGNEWQGRRDSNTQPAVLETAALPLSHSPLKKLCIKQKVLYFILMNLSISCLLFIL